MPETTPQPPPHPQWENGWVPDTSRAPGTRRLWLAGTLAIATIVACATAVAVSHNAPDRASTPPATDAATDNGPGLLSFASPTASAGQPKGTSGMSSAAAAADPSATATGAQHATDGPTSSPSAAKPSKSAATGGGSGSSGGSGGSSGSGGSAPQSGTDRRSVRSVNYPDRYWHVSDGFVKLDAPRGSESLADSSFTVVKGLANSYCYSFETADGRYLRHRNFVLRAMSDDGSALFEQDATFCARTSSYSGAVMLESVNYPGRYLRHQNFQLKLDPYQNSDLYRADSAFRLVDPLA
ncbi:AbfB domain-containing protein [Streptomyces humi]|uniref:AbfB domain-containing protein n=1 Tax=Streptomyces humi TaxID=1428620 RepID=UPI0006288FFC|nr:AbfB domain-containing protein [Streptomyces humi]